jgi:NAD(P)-dependent dehydrogenase (short-subunit alcohol dehydrogenase family)
MEIRRVLKGLKFIAIAGAATGVAAGAAAVGGVGLAGYAYWRYRRGPDLSGQVALVTGSSRGLGFAMAREFVRQGCDVIICARDQQELQSAADELKQLGTTVLAIPCDVSDREQVARMIEQVNARFGGIDVLVNNAGVMTVGPIESQTIEDFEEAMKVMFWGVVHPTLAVLPQMLARRGGRIATITSVGGKVSMPHLLPYNCAKFAAVGFSEGIHAELSRYGIRVTTVVPGLMRTGSHLNASFKGDNEAEYSWFRLAATLPLVSMDARRAARAIVSGIQRGETEIILTPQARALATVHGVFPGWTTEALGLVNRLLPKSTGDAGKQSTLGRDSETAVSSSVFTGLGRQAARDLRQNEGKRRAEGLRNSSSEPAVS